MKKKLIMLLTSGLIAFNSVGVSSFAYAKEISKVESFKLMRNIRCEVNTDKISTLVEQEKYEEALTYINECLKTQKTEDLYIVKGYILMQMDNPEEAVNAYIEALKINPNNDTSLNNAGWAYLGIGDYEKALYYIEKSLKIGDQDAIEYVNKGDALYGLNRYEEAIKAYDEALKLEPYNDVIYYDKGTAYYWLEKYDEALNCFVKSEELYGSIEENAFQYLMGCYINLGREQEAEACVQKVLDQNGENIDSYYMIANAYSSEEKLEKALYYYKKALELDPKNEYILRDMGDVYYDQENYSKAIEYFQQVLNIDKSSPEAYDGIIYSYISLDNLDKAEEYCKQWIETSPKEYMAYFYMGNVLSNKGDYKGACQYYDRTLEINNNFEEAYMSKVDCLFNDKLYTECIALLEEIRNKYPDNIYVYRWMADSYSCLFESEKAIEYYKKALEYNPKESELLMSLTLEYYYNQEYDEAEKVLKQIEKNDETKEFIEIFTGMLEDRKLPLQDQVVKFVKENYLYLDQVKGLDEKIKIFKEKKSVTSKDIRDFIEAVRIPSDRFTFVVADEDYDMFSGEEIEVSTEYQKLDNNLHYIKVDSFNYKTYQEFCDIISGIENTKDAELIIDVRSNGGGNAKVANDMLDLLLPECAPSSLTDSSGYVDSFYSAPSQVEFKNIYVFVDEYSASCSELLALSLRKYLDNVTIIGRPTFGKGVSQTLYDNREAKLAIFLVHSYWSVEDENILNSRIQPDIYVEGDDIKSYLDAIK